ncbi:MAG: outer membrane scaffolding protein for murein synthesis (MipA/OmpV family) [Gammaproteobacteria bacterium]|jgi:outer membrane scaffolding protein for murein synthesis (MipA/OmpV family)
MTILNLIRPVSLAALIGLVPIVGQTDSTFTQKSPHFGDRGWDVNLGIGIGVASDSIYKRNDDDREKGIYIPLTATWYGESFHFTADEREGLLLGYTIAKTANWAVDGLLSPRFFGPIDNELLDHLDDRNGDFHAGVRYTLYGDDNVIKLEVSKDISNTHDGFILSASYEQEWQVKNWIVRGSASAAFISEDMIDYYFNVSGDEATVAFPAYNGSASRLAYISASTEYPINENWIFKTQIAHIIPGDEIKDSPITSDKESWSAGTAGVTYKF